jgi:hypothetical protein
MAINKTIKTKYNIDAKYWKITAYNYIESSGKYEIIISGFLDKKSRDNLSHSLIKKNYILDDIKDNMNAMYNFIKQQDDFLNSEDI